MVSQNKQILALDESLCLSCGGCVGICPELSLDLDSDLVLHIDQETCNPCQRCVKVCPVSALSLKEKS
jgi:ferredoxin